MTDTMYRMRQPTQDPYREALAKAVATSRTSRGLSKEEAARRAGVSSITWKRVEDGLRVQDAKLNRITSSLEITYDPARQWLLDNGVNRGVPPSQPRHSPSDRGQATFPELFAEWIESATETLRLEMEYARRRNLSPVAARAELWEALSIMGQQGDPEGAWIPPWDEDRAMQEAADWAAEYGPPDEEPAGLEPGTYIEPPPLNLAARTGIPDTRAADAQDEAAEAPDPAPDDE